MKLADVLGGVSPTHVTGGLGTEIRDLVLDSRKARPDCLFFALPGTRTNGNRHVREAVGLGAAAVVSELAPPPPPFSLSRRRAEEEPVTWVQVPDAAAAMSRAASNFFSRPSAALAVVGVTGTNGKTTATYFLESILLHAGAVAGVVGTVHCRLRGREIERASNTTPLAPDLQRLLSRMVRGGATHAVLEVSSHALALKRVEDVDFDAAVFTNLHRDHLDYHKTREAYFEAKARLLDLLSRPGSSKRRRLAVLNRDDPSCLPFRRRVVDAEIVTYGTSPEADASASGVVTSLDGTLFVLRWRGRDWAVRLRLIGGYNVHNALAAAVPALWLGLPVQKVLEGLSALERVPGRLEPVSEGQPFHVFVDYAHTDSALDNVLSYLKAIPHKRLITVFGCGGDRDKTKRGPMGVVGCAHSDLVLLTSDNPRSEEPMDILRQIEAGIRQAGLENYRIIPDRREAVAEAVRQAREGDCVLIAGKGHETAQILKDRTVYFDDRQAAREAIRMRAWT